MSAVYRIPYQNVVGDIGFYVYQQTYPFYSFVLVLSTYGFPVIISKLLAEAKETKQSYTRAEILLVSWMTLSLLGIGLWALLFFASGRIAGAMDDRMLAESLRIISISFLFLPVMSIIKGYFQSEGEMKPTATAQIVEQIVRVGVILAVCVAFAYSGWSIYDAAKGAYIGSLIGGAAGSVCLLAFWTNKKKLRDFFYSLRLKRSLWLLSGNIIVQGLLFAFSSLILVFIQFADAFILYPEMVASGMEATEAKQWKGIYDRGQPLIQLGTAATISISLTFVPLIGKYRKMKDSNSVKYYTELTFRLSLMLGLAAAVGLFWIIEPVNVLLFTDNKGSGALGVLILTIFFSSVLMAGMFVLQTIGRSWVSVLLVVLGILLKIYLMRTLVPSYHLLGAALSTTVPFGVMALLVLHILRTIFKSPILDRRSISIIVAASLWMSVILLLDLGLFDFLERYIKQEERILAMFEVGISVISGACVYLLYILKKGLFTQTELAALPLGSKLSKLLPKSR